MTRIEILLRGRIADSTLDLIESRFGSLAIRPASPTAGTEIVGEMDQAAERALLALLWDTGHEVVSVRSTPLSDS